MVVTGLAASWYLSLIAAAAYLCIGVLLPRFFSRRMAETGMRYRRELEQGYLELIKEAQA